MRLKHYLVLLLSFAFLFAAGCGGAGKDNVSQGNAGGAKVTAKGIVDPSALLTKAEVEAALGEQVKEPECRDTKNPLGQKLCFYSPVSEKAVQFVQLSIVQNESMTKTLRDQGYDVAQLYNETKKNLSDTKLVPGIGDEAFWATNGLHILKGNIYLNISTGNTSKPENLEMAKHLAEKALSRL